MSESPTVFIVDDDDAIREGLSLLLESAGQACKLYSSATAFLESYNADWAGCLVLDIRMPRMTGLDLQKKLQELGASLPIIFITGHGDIPMAVEAMRRGALDFIRKPFREQDLLDRINEAIDLDAGKRKKMHDRDELLGRIATLSSREREVFNCVAQGKMNKLIAGELKISERTVEVHRSQVMKKLQARTLAQLVRIKIEAEGD